MSSGAERFFIAVLIVLVSISGCAQPPGQEAVPPPEEETPSPTAQQAPPQGPNPFLTGPPELRTCLRQELGEEAFNALALQERMPSPEEKALIKGCIDRFGAPEEPPEKKPGEARAMEGLRWVPKGPAIEGHYADAEVVEAEEGYRMYFGGEPEVAQGRLGIYSAISSDGVEWRIEPGMRIGSATFPDVVRLPDGGYRMYFQRGGVIVSATSEDGLTWREDPGVRIGRGGHDGLDDLGVGAPTTLRLRDGSYLMVYHTEKQQRFCERSPNPSTTFLFYAASPDGLNFEKKGMALDPRNDIFCDLLGGPELVLWDDGMVHLFFWSHKGVYESIHENGAFTEPKLVLSRAPGEQPPADPTLIKIKDSWFMYYGQHQKGIYYATLQGRAETPPAVQPASSWMKEEGIRVRGGVPYVTAMPEGGYRLYYCREGGIYSAVSRDGLTFTEEPGVRITPGCDPSIVELEDGGYRMYYKVEVDMDTHVIHSAVSRDGLTWVEEGLRFQNMGSPCNGWTSVPDAIRLRDGGVRIYFVCDKMLNAVASIISQDGLNFKLEEGLRLKRAVDPNVIRLPDNTYRMFYATAPEGRPVVPPDRIYTARSRDGLKWTVEGEILRAGGPYDPSMVVDPSAILLPSGKYRVYYGGGGPVILSAISK
jgi:hypothetical protein